MVSNTLTLTAPPAPPVKLKCQYEKCGREFEPAPRKPHGPPPSNRFCSKKCQVNAACEAYRLRNRDKKAAHARTIREVGGAVLARMAKIVSAMAGKLGTRAIREVAATAEKVEKRAIREIATEKGLSVKKVTLRLTQYRNRRDSRLKSQARPEHKQTLKDRRALVKKMEPPIDRKKIALVARLELLGMEESHEMADQVEPPGPEVALLTEREKKADRAKRVDRTKKYRVNNRERIDREKDRQAARADRAAPLSFDNNPAAG